MSQSIVIKGRDNPAIFEFSFTGDFASLQLNTFSRVVVNIGTESYSTDLTPSNLFIVGDTELRLKIGDTTTLDVGSYTPEIIGYSAAYDDGYLLSGAKKRLFSNITVV